MGSSDGEEDDDFIGEDAANEEEEDVLDQDVDQGQGGTGDGDADQGEGGGTGDKGDERGAGEQLSTDGGGTDGGDTGGGDTNGGSGTRSFEEWKKLSETPDSPEDGEFNKSE